MAGRFIKLYDKILQWEWYSDINTCRLFIHLLLKANYKDQTFQGNVIRRGQMATSLSSLASQTCLTERQVRVSLDRLKMTGEVSSSTYPRYRVITVLHYDEYQSDVRQNVTLMTSKLSPSRQAECQPHDKQTVSQDVNKYRTIEPITIEDRTIDSPTESKVSAQRFTPPTLEEVTAYCRERGNAIDPQRFIDYYSTSGWIMKNGRKMKDWKAAVRTWEGNDKKQVQVQQQKRVLPAQDFSQRDYSHVQEDDIARLNRELQEAKQKGII